VTTPGREQWRGALGLAWRDFLHEWRISLCLIFAVSAVLAPLLVLFGLRSGIVTTLSERLKSDPVNRELVMRGHHVLPPEWFAAMAHDTAVGFVLPRTRRLSATMTLERGDSGTLQDVDLVPTAAGDPLLPAGTPIPADLHDVLLTSTAASRLHTEPGTALQGLVTRQLDGRPEAVRVPLTVRGVLPETAFGHDAVFVPLELLVAVEDYRDGFAVTELGVADGQPSRLANRPFASARLYARELDDVAPLAERLRAQDIEVVTRAHEIESVKAIDRVLTLIFVVLAAIAVTGAFLSLTASLWANVDRKRREIALLRLLGLRAGPVIGFPATQAVLVALGGLALSAVAYVVVAAIFNRAFATQLGRDEFVCALQPRHAVYAVWLTLLFALIASIVGGYRATRIDPAESLREV